MPILGTLLLISCILNAVRAQVCFDDYGSGYSSSGVTFLSNPLYPSDNENKERFGKAVDIYGNRSVICAYLSDAFAIDAGKCYVFVKQSNGTWVEVQTFFGPNPGSGDYFGFDVDMDDTWLIVGASQDTISGNAYAGSATVYNWNGSKYVNPTFITHPNPTSMDLCGTSVAIQWPYALVGCPGDDPTASDGGSVIVYRIVSPGVVTYNSTLTVASGANDNFGSDIAVDGTVVLIGAAANDDIDTNAGKAHRFHLVGNSLVLQYSFTGSTVLNGDRFGDGVALVGSYMLVGALNHDVGANNAGAAYLFADSGTSATQLAILYADNPYTNAYFGETVAISQVSPSKLHLVIGAYLGRSNDGNPTGAAYVFSYDIAQGSMQYLTRLLAYQGQSNDYFGGDVAIYNRTLLIGAERDSLDNNNWASGTAYIYETSSCTNNSSECYTLQFDVDDLGAPLSAGQNITNQYSLFKLGISSFSPSNNPVKVFDSNSPTCANGSSIGTPNVAFSGPGVGSGGTITNDQNLQKVLILQNSNTACSPEVYNQTDGYILLNFSTTVNIQTISIIDGRYDGSAISNIELYRTYNFSDTPSTVSIPYIGPDSVQTFSLAAYHNILTAKINFGGPAAISSLSYCTEFNYTATPSPTPSPTPTPIPSPTPVPSPPIPSCSLTCANFTNYTSGNQLSCDSTACNCSLGVTTCDVYTNGSDWRCVEPSECCANPPSCAVDGDCCGGYQCYLGTCSLIPTPLPSPAPAPSPAPVPSPLPSPAPAPIPSPPGKKSI